MAADAQAIAGQLQASLDRSRQKEAEAALRSLEATPNFSIVLLQITSSEQYPQTIRLAAALYFKNLIRRNWIDADGNHKLPKDEVDTIKRELVALMVAVPPNIQAQLGDAISEIAQSDFWEQWTTLTDDLVSRLTPDNAKVNNGVLRVAHSIFKRWRPLFPSDSLNLEIKQEGGKFCLPFLSLLQSTDSLIQQNQANKQLLEDYMGTLHLSIKVLHDLSCQDLLESLEENIEGICRLLIKYLQYDNQLLQTDDETEVGPLEFVKGSIFEMLRMWVTKYEEDIKELVGEFANTTWSFLTGVGQEIKYDVVASRALQFLTSIASNQAHAQTFNSDATLQQVIELVILPSIALRESDIEMFEDEPMEFIRRDLEGSEAETRRKAATDFLRKLMDHFQDRVTNTVLQYVQQYLQGSAGGEAWRSKDTAIYLYCSIAAVGTVTSTQGVTKLNPHTNILEFFATHIASHLVSDSSHPILQTDAIRFLYMFRTHISPEQWQQAFPMIVQRIASSNPVVCTYAAIAIERVLSISTPTNEAVIPRTTVSSQAQEMLKRLFVIVEKDPAPEKIQENEFLMRCIMRVLVVVREDVQPYYEMVLINFVNIVKVIRHNPSNPMFYYYLFEGVGALIRFAAPANPDKIEQTLFTPFVEILQSDVQEFTPYVFQLFAALLESNPSAPLPDYYQSLVQPVLMPVLWDTKGNTPALSRLVSALVRRGGPEFVNRNQLEPTLGIFQKLISSKANDVYGFDILEAIFSSIPLPDLQQYLPTIFNLLLTRLSSSKTQQFTSRFVRLYHHLCTIDSLGTDRVIAIFDQIQESVYVQVYLSIILPSSLELVRPLDRKLAVVSFTRTLTTSQKFAEQYAKGWARTCEALLAIMLNPPVIPKDSDPRFEQDVEDLAFGVGFTKLTTCERPPKDPFPEIQDLKAWIGQTLQQANANSGGRISNFVNERLSNETKQALLTYMQGQTNGA